jgi:hypothetical protein
MKRVFKGHVLSRNGDESSCNNHVIGKGGDDKVLVTIWLGEEVTEKF